MDNVLLKRIDEMKDKLNIDAPVFEPTGLSLPNMNELMSDEETEPKKKKKNKKKKKKPKTQDELLADGEAKWQPKQPEVTETEQVVQEEDKEEVKAPNIMVEQLPEDKTEA